MKKFFAVLLILCLAFAGLTGWLGSASPKSPAVPAPSAAPEEAPAAPGESAASPEASEAPEESETPEDSAAGSATVDLDAIQALHQPKEVILTVNGREITWDKYFYMLVSQVMQVQNYFESMRSYYGMEQHWTDEYAEGTSFAQAAVDNTELNLLQLCAIEFFAEENHVTLPEEVLSELEEQLQEDIANICGEGATEADFEDYLAGIYMNLDLYRWVFETNSFYQQNYLQLYGEAGELYDEAAAMAYLVDNGYLSAGHILFMTIDPATGEALDEAAKAQKLEQAQAVAQELQAITDTEALLARFRELKDQYCEDTGKASYPEGYTFTPGTMVQEFEDAVNALEDYQVSDPVETSYGYHVIMRLPLSVDATIEYASDGVTPLTAKGKAANQEYGQRLQSFYESLTPEYAPGFTPPDLLNYITEG